MTWYQTAIVFAVSWWLILFMVLPWGVRPQDEPVPGSERGAPAQPHLLVKFAVTTVLAALATWGIAVVISSGLISFHQPPSG